VKRIIFITVHSIINYIRSYFAQTNKTALVCISLFTALLVFINYWYGVDDLIRSKDSFALKLFSWSLIFLCAFASPYVFYQLITGKKFFSSPVFILLLLIAPLIFALKMSVRIELPVSGNPFWDHYWTQVLFWPLVSAAMTIVLFIIWRSTRQQQDFYGLTRRNINFTPYFIMLACMIPLVAAASTQPDFLDMYPKLKSLNLIPDNELTTGHQLLYELSYASDFFNIELFFRGFLVFAFMKWAGKDAILPMACFYCTIHFGKPLGECISSYFGGILLGIVAFETRSILGGLLVHIGIAWMMELGGYLGNMLMK
jgi:hypothetical protein